MPKSNRGTSSWKSLVNAHKKGPKRIKIPGTRRPKDHTPFTDITQSRTVQLIMDEGITTKKIIIVMYKEKFSRLNLKQGKTYSMFPGSLTRTARILKPALDKMTHNDVVLKKVKEMKLAGKCIVFPGQAHAPNAIIHILRKHTNEEKSITKYVAQQFNNINNTYKTPIEKL